MKLIEPYWEVLNEKDLYKATKEIEVAGRTCKKSEKYISEVSDEKFCRMIIEEGHEAMLEFGPSPVVKFVCDRGVSHELVRHRLCDFAQESTRYCNYSKDKFDNQITFIIPPWVSLPEGEYKLEKRNNVETYPEVLSLTKSENDMNWYWLMTWVERNYNILISRGWQPQQARSVLPNSLKTEIVVKANIREWRHIFKQRTSKAAHPQMRELMVPLLKHFQILMPVLFDDIDCEAFNK